MIQLNGTAWHVTKNLFFALSYLRHPASDRIVWIDALAINQANIPERNMQVMRIRTIYSRASCTLICVASAEWIQKEEDRNECVNLLFNFAQDCVAQIQGDATDNKWFCEKFAGIDTDVRIKIGLALTYVLLLPYWSRVWVIQEMMYSHNAVLMYRTYCISYPNFVWFLPTMIDIAYHNLQTNWEMLAARLDFMRLGLLKHLPLLKREVECLLLPRASARRGQYLTLTDWMEYAHCRMSTDPRDKIFGFYSCFPQEVRRLITVDYSKEIPEVLTQITPLLFTEAKTLDVMFRRNGKLGLSADVPSWVWIPESFNIQATLQSPQPRIEIPLSEGRVWRASGSLPLTFSLLDHGRTLHAHGKTVFIVKFVAPPVVPVRIVGEDKVKEVFADLGGREISTIMNHFRQLWQLFKPLSPAKQIVFIKAFHLGTPNDLAILCLLLWIMDVIPLRQLGLPPAVKYTFEHCGRSMFSCFNASGQSSADDEDVTYGLGPSNLVPGDKVCVLQGCSVPVILRQVEDRHILIGEAKVPDIMCGEAVRWIEQGEEQPEDFFIK